MTIDTSRALWSAVGAIAVGTFTVVTSEMLPVGLLTPIGRELNVSDGIAGLTMTAPGLTAAIAAPLLAIATRRLDRRLLMIGLMALLTVANLVAALAPTFAVLMVARVITGVSIGGFWAFAAGLGARLAPQSPGRATSLVVGGVAVASVLGVPAGTLITSLASWRWAFAAIALLALGIVVALTVLLPSLPPAGTVRLGGVWRTPALRAVLIGTALIVVGHFAAYTYVRPFLEQSEGAITTILLVYGVAGVVGNFVAGSLADPRKVLVVLAVLVAAATVLLPIVDGPIPLIVVWGLAYGGVSVTASLWMIKSGGGEAGMALLSSIFNAAISMGAFIGGQVVDHLSLPAVMWLGALLALVSAVYAGMSGRSRTIGS